MPRFPPDSEMTEPVGFGAGGEPADATVAFTQAFFEALRSSGVEHVCICPGSRSIPLTLAAYRTGHLRCSSHHDERSAGFFALGLARASRRPVALICTSGTAAANFLPAVVEACYARVPLVVLTADRPPELRDCGAGQAIDQLGLFGRHVRRFVEVDAASASPAMLRYARSLACRAVADSLGLPRGPVHLNWPLREPFSLDAPAHPSVVRCADHRSIGGAADAGEPVVKVRCEAGTLTASDQQLASLMDLLREHERGIIACGALDPDAELTAALAALSHCSGWPILADALSQLRSGAHVGTAPVLAHADILLRNASFARDHTPEVVLTIGGPPVSKAQRLWLEAAPPAHWLLIDPDDSWSEPGHLATAHLRLDPAALARTLAGRWGEPRYSDWRLALTRADARVATFLDTAIQAESSLLEPRAAYELARLLPGDAILYVSNSMPVRDLDAFLPLRRSGVLEILCNRGANGIDGVVSSALGAAAAGRGPVVLLIGDIALLHDLGGLWAARRHRLDLTIIVLNNDGGGIFSFLPIADGGDSVGFDEFFRLRHGMDFASAATLYGLDYTRIEQWEDYSRALDTSLSTDGTHLIEIPIDAAANLRHFHSLIQRAGSAATAELDCCRPSCQP